MQVDSGSSPGRRPAGNTALKALRLSRHWTQAEFAAEFEKASRALGKVLSLSVRQVRRWESDDPPCRLPPPRRAAYAYASRMIPTSCEDEVIALRHSTTNSLLTRRDVVVVSTVSCIYGL